MPPSPRHWTLMLLRDGKPGQFWTLEPGSLSLGRAPSNQIQLADASVSRRHTEFVCGPNGVSVRDLKSRNGMLVNGVPRQKADLQPGDRLKIGIFELQLASAPPAAGQPVPAPPVIAAETAVYPTDEQGIRLPDERRDRKLSTLYHVCFWIAEGAEEKDFVPKCLRLLLDGFRAEEVHLYSADGRLESFVTRRGSKPAVRLAAFLSRRFQGINEAMSVNGASVAQHQKDVGRFNYLVGPLHTNPSVPVPAPFLFLIRPQEWEDFDTEDRVLLQAISQQWVRGQSKAAQVQNLRQENARLKERLNVPVLLGNCLAMEKLREQARRAAATNVTILLEGETGSGKEVVAQFIHDHSARSSGPFVKLNCAAIPDGLIESELFGHVQGAFTDARNDRLGKFAQAHRGTLFFDEIGEMPLALQAKALRAIESGEIEPLGSEGVGTVDVRIIAATHRDLAMLVSERQFREDLFYRLNVMRLRVPPLREHVDDVAVLAAHFLERFVVENGLAEMGFAPEALLELKHYAWPGNVRQLRSVVQRCAVSAQPPLITSADVVEQIRDSGR